MTPDQEEQVRRALADARASRNPMPPEVAGRLDDTLARLVRERKRLEASLHRRRWPQVLLAAAAVVVVVVGGGFLLRQVTSGGGLSSASGGAESQARDTGGGGGAAGSAANGAGGVPQSASAQGTVVHGPAVRLHTATLRHDVRGYLDHVSLLASPPGSPAPTAKPSWQPNRNPAGQPFGASPSAGCTSPALTGGDRAVGALLDGRPVTLVLRAPHDGTRVAQVYPCADPQTPMARVTLPARPVQPAR